MARSKKSKKIIAPIFRSFFILAMLVTVLYFFVNYIPGQKSDVYPLSEEDIKSPRKLMAKQLMSPAIYLPEVIENGSRDNKKIALTFDADMTYGMQEMIKNNQVASWYDQRIIQLLKREKVKATIFMTGLWVETYPEEAKEIAKNPLFEIGNHTYSHPSFSQNCYGLTEVKRGQEDNEVIKAQRVIFEKTGISPQYFRFPGGCYKKEDVLEISRLGMKIVHWDVVGGDAMNNNPDTIAYNLKNKVRNGSIIVLHLNAGPFAPKTFEGLEKSIPYLKEKGFEFVKISDFVD